MHTDTDTNTRTIIPIPIPGIGIGIGRYRYRYKGIGLTLLCETYGKAFHIHQNHRATRKAIRQVIKQMMFVKTRLNVKTHLTNLAEELLSSLHKSPQTATLNIYPNTLLHLNTWQSFVLVFSYIVATFEVCVFVS